MKYYPFPLFNVSSLIEVAIHIWLGSIGNTTEFQFAFRIKIWWKYIFEGTNCRRIILISLCKKSGRKRSPFRNCSLVSSCNVLYLQLGYTQMALSDKTKQRL